MAASKVTVETGCVLVCLWEVMTVFALFFSSKFPFHFLVLNCGENFPFSPLSCLKWGQGGCEQIYGNMTAGQANPPQAVNCFYLKSRGSTDCRSHSGCLEFLFFLS